MLIENREQFEKYARKAVEDNTFLLPPKYDDLFIELMLKSFDIGAKIEKDGCVFIKEE